MTDQMPSFAKMEAIANTKRPLPDRLRDATEYAEHEGYIARVTLTKNTGLESVSRKVILPLTDLDYLIERVEKLEAVVEAVHRIGWPLDGDNPATTALRSALEELA